MVSVPCGHGQRGGQLAFEDDSSAHDPLRLVDLRDLLVAIGSGVRCVVLNACWSAEDADVLAAHVDFVIGMVRPVPDRAAIAVAGSFLIMAASDPGPPRIAPPGRRTFRLLQTASEDV